MSLLTNLRIAVGGLLSNKLRSSLTVLGILIGVGAVIILVAVGKGSSVSVENQIQKLGTNRLLVLSTGRGGGRGGLGGFGGGASRATTGTQTQQHQLTIGDAQALQNADQAPDIKSASPVVSTSVTAVFSGATHSTTVTGSTPGFLESANYSVASGTPFTDADEAAHRRVVLLGTTVVTDLFGTTDPVGQKLTLNGVSFTVAGVLAGKGSNGAQDLDDVIIAPLTGVQDGLTGYGALQQISVEATGLDSLNAAQAEVTSILDGRHHIAATASPDFTIINQGTLLATSDSTQQTFTVLLGAVAAISLLVGGIGVMNIMLVTVTERTREIGIRKAIGARPSVILLQFLIEAVLLTTIGGLTGVAAGLAGSRFQIVGVTPVVQPYSIALAFGVALAVGLFFGSYPASRAAALRPIDALRHE